MNYRTYKIRGINSTSGKSKGITVSAYTDVEAIILGKQKGLIDPTIEEIVEFTTPTERQLKYAEDLEITIPTDSSIEDVSALITRKLEDDYDPDEGLIEFAESFRFKFSKLIGNCSLCELLFYELEDEDKAAFFVFQIYRQLVNEEHANLAIHPEKEFMYHIGSKIIKRNDLLSSMERYDGRDLAYFGEKTIDGWDKTGGSQKTKAYKYVADTISKHYKVNKTKRSSNLSVNTNSIFNSNIEFKGSHKKPLQNTSNPDQPHDELWVGCVGIIAIVIVIILYFLIF